MAKVKTNFSFHIVDVGLDVHKRSWNAAVFLDGVYVRNIHQPPSPKALHTFLTDNFPGARYRCAYECGKFGFWIQRQFTDLHVECLVINPADIPCTHKDEVYKSDSRDARGIGEALAKGQLKAIYVPCMEQEADRHLVRMRKKIWRDLVRCKNRVKGFLDYVGIPIPPQYDNPNWSHNFIEWLGQLPLNFSAMRMTLNYQIREVQLLRRELLSICNDIRRLMRSKKYKNIYYRLRTITGIGPLTAAALITEIGDMKRFPSFYHLNSFIGLMPMEHSSGEKILKGRITVRKHRQLRSDLVECAWAAKRNDPALALYYNEQMKKGKNGKAAIVKVARKLLSRIRYVWLSGQSYQVAVIQ
jgi:transposase